MAWHSEYNSEIINAHLFIYKYIYINTDIYAVRIQVCVTRKQPCLIFIFPSLHLTPFPKEGLNSQYYLWKNILEINWRFLYRGHRAALKELTATWNLNQIYLSSQKGKSSKQFLGFFFSSSLADQLAIEETK